MRFRLASAPLAAALLCAAPALADEDEELRLRWTAPPGCPSSDEVRAAALRGGRTAKTGLLEAEARVEQRTATDGETRWNVRLQTRRGGVVGQREIDASSCRGVADATAVVLALALMPPGTGPTERPEGPIASEQAQERDAPRVEAPRPPARPHAFAVGASVAADPSTLPSTTMGGSLTLAWTPARFRVELDGRRWAAQSRTVGGGSDAGARFSLTSVGGRGCWSAVAGRFDLAPCAGADVVFVSAPGYGADANYEATAAWTTITAGALLRLKVADWLAVRARIDAFTPLSRPTFVVEGEGSLHRPPTIGATGSLGVEALFL